MLEDEFEGYDPEEIEDLNLGPEEEDFKGITGSETIETTYGRNLDPKSNYLVRIYHKNSTKLIPVEGDVTELLKDNPQKDLVGLIKYVCENPKNETGKDIAQEALDDIGEFERTGNLEYQTKDEYLGIKVLDKEKKTRNLYENFVKRDQDREFGEYALPTAKALDFFEERPEEKIYRLDLQVDIIDAGGN